MKIQEHLKQIQEYWEAHEVQEYKFIAVDDLTDLDYILEHLQEIITLRQKLCNELGGC